MVTLAPRRRSDSHATDTPGTHYRGMTLRPTPFLSLVAPTYNERINLAAFIGRTSAVLDARMPGSYEIIVVDDDSPDLTWEHAAALARLHPAVSVIRRQGRRGLATAVVAGWQAARGDWLGVIDADLQHPPEILSPLIDAVAAGADLAVGTRNATGGGVSTWNLGRRLISRTAQLLASAFVPSARGTSDPMSGLFIVRRTALQVSVLKPIGYKILLEVLVRGTIQNITDVPYVFDERRHGRSKVTLRVYREYLAHLWQLRQAVRRSD